MNTPQEYSEVAVFLARNAGTDLQASHEHLHTRRKPNGLIETSVEYDIQATAAGWIQQWYPTHVIDCENHLYENVDTENVWIIDPLSGTREYVEGGVGTHGFSIAKRRGAMLEASAFYAVSHDELYTAAAGLGARVNKDMLRVNDEHFRPGVAYDYGYRGEVTPAMRRFFQEVGPPLRHYSATYQACMVARGISTFAIVPNATIHDIATGALLVIEAGGRVTDLQGDLHRWDGSVRDAVFSNGRAHDEVIETLHRQQAKNKQM